MRFTQPTPEQEKLWQEWLNEPGREAIRKVASRFEPWTLYKLKTTGQRVYILSFSDPSRHRCDWCNGTGGPVPPSGDPCNNCGGSGKVVKVTCRVGVSGEFNLVTFERDVFGIDPKDLEECDLPGPDELLGTMELPVDEIKKLRAEHPNGAPPSVMNELVLRFPLRKGGQNRG